MTPAIELNELVTAVRFPPGRSGHGYGFVEFSRRHGDFAIVSAAALLTEDGAGKITRASVTLGGIGVGAGARHRGRAGADRPDRPTTSSCARPAKPAANTRRSTTSTRRPPTGSISRP